MKYTYTERERGERVPLSINLRNKFQSTLIPDVLRHQHVRSLRAFLPVLYNQV
jgi:hypothetical protein